MLLVKFLYSCCVILAALLCLIVPTHVIGDDCDCECSPGSYGTPEVTGCCGCEQTPTIWRLIITNCQCFQPTTPPIPCDPNDPHSKCCQVPCGEFLLFWEPPPASFNVCVPGQQLVTDGTRCFWKTAESCTGDTENCFPIGGFGSPPPPPLWEWGCYCRCAESPIFQCTKGNMFLCGQVAFGVVQLDFGGALFKCMDKMSGVGRVVTPLPGGSSLTCTFNWEMDPF